MRYLYKYVTPSTGKIILANRRLRWSTPSLLNDPFDMQFAFQLRVDPSIVRAKVIEKLWQHHYGALEDRPLNELGRVIRSLRGQFPIMTREELAKQCDPVSNESISRLVRSMTEFNKSVFDGITRGKILCLSEFPDIILMWSYYAQNHQGIVLRFRTDTYNNPFAMAKPVKYANEMPSLYNEESLSDMFAGYNPISESFLLDELVLTKSCHWNHEREWRIFAGSGRSNAPHEDIHFSEVELDGAILGARMSDVDKRDFFALLQSGYPHVEVLVAKTNPNAYELLIEAAAGS